MAVRSLVVYYSRTGRTKGVATAIAARLQGDMEEIADPTNRKGSFGYMRSAFEASRKKLAPIEEPQRDPGNYDLVVIGTPVWAGNMSSPVRAYLARYKERIREAAFFATAGGMGAKAACRGMADLWGRNPRGMLSVGMAELRRGLADRKVERFVAGLKGE